MRYVCAVPESDARRPASGRPVARLRGWRVVKRRALGALEAYLIESGRGQELDLPKGAKLELELGRALYLVKE